MYPITIDFILFLSRALTNLVELHQSTVRSYKIERSSALSWSCIFERMVHWLEIRTRRSDVQTFGEHRRMCFFRRNQDAAHPTLHLQAWSTNIGDYSCNEGLPRFLVDGTACDTNTITGILKPRQTAKLPIWYNK